MRKINNWLLKPKMIFLGLNSFKEYGKGSFIMKKVSIFGLGYVGIANALLLSQKDSVVAYDILKQKTELLQQKNHL